jgi:hypothetical protein
MDQIALEGYFSASPLRARLLLAIGVVLLVILAVAAPGTGRYDELHQRVFDVFTSEKLGVNPALLEVLFVSGYVLALVIFPLVMLLWGILELRRYRRRRTLSDAQADAALSERMARLPARLAAHLGLPPLQDAQERLVLWAPRLEDRELYHPLDRKQRKKVKNVPGRIAVGQDDLVRCARLSVLVLEKRAARLYALQGFYDLLEEQLSGETWGEYRLEHALGVVEDADFGRLALQMADGKHFVAHLLMGKEGARLSKAQAAYPLVRFEEAGESLRLFCGIA